MHKTWIIITALIIGASLQIGCGGGDDTAANSPKGPEGPKEVSLKMLRAIAASDGPTAVSCYYASLEDKEHMIKTVPWMVTARKLVEAANQAYGAETWTLASAKAKIGMITPDLKNADANIQCEINGDTAKCILRGLPHPLRLSKKNGKWLIIPEPRQRPPMSQRGRIIEQMETVRVAVEAIIPRVGTGNLSADDICAEIKAIIDAHQ